MIEAPIPLDEKQRLESLTRLHLLDTPIEERFERITRLACRLFDVPISAFTLIDEHRQWYKSIQGMQRVEGRRQLSVCAHTILGEEIMLVPNAKQDPRFFDHPFVTGDAKVAFYAGCPVHAPDGKTIGTLCAMDTRPREMRLEYMQVLRDLALMVETELRVEMLSKAQAKLITELDAAHRLALIDSLTRLWNYGGIINLLKREWNTAVRSQNPLAIVMADVDHFKKINDSYGHPIGDVVLQAVSRNLLAAVRAEDIIGRVGGEEFLLILPACSVKKLRQAIERVQSFFTRSPIMTVMGELNVTLSFGAVAILPDSSLILDECITLADNALYEAKRSGRNCTKIIEMPAFLSEKLTSRHAS